MKQLNAMDKGFLLAESRETPMHVGGVALNTLPDGAETAEFLQSLASNLQDAKAFLPPFGDRLKTGPLGLAGPTFWEPDPALDLDYHIRHSALPQPGRYRERTPDPRPAAKSPAPPGFPHVYSARRTVEPPCLFATGLMVDVFV